MQLPWTLRLCGSENESRQKSVAYQSQNTRQTGVRRVKLGPWSMKMDGNFTYNVEKAATRESGASAQAEGDCAE